VIQENQKKIDSCYEEDLDINENYTHFFLNIEILILILLL